MISNLSIIDQTSIPTSISTNKIFPLTCEYTVDIEGSDGEEESSVTERVKLDLLQVYFIICNKSA